MPGEIKPNLEGEGSPEEEKTSAKALEFYKKIKELWALMEERAGLNAASINGEPDLEGKRGGAVKDLSRRIDSLEAEMKAGFGIEEVSYENLYQYGKEAGLPETEFRGQHSHEKNSIQEYPDGSYLVREVSEEPADTAFTSTDFRQLGKEEIADYLGLQIDLIKTEIDSLEDDKSRLEKLKEKL